MFIERCWLLIDAFHTIHIDGIDGKQARRTGTSGPLGELFDHGVDSYSAALIPIYMFSIFGTHATTPIRMHFITWNIFLNFFLTHFEKYNTGVMYLPWAYDFTMWVRIALLLTHSAARMFVRVHSAAANQSEFKYVLFTRELQLP